jgi:gluconokinase
MPLVPGLLSPYDAVRGFVYLPRLVSKIRLHAAGQLHADFVNNLGKAFDDRCCQYLGIKYDELRVWVLQNPAATQDEVLAWAEAKGRKLSTNDIEIWNGFMTKRGWRDEANEVLVRRLKENGLTVDAGVDTMFDYIEVDEGRPARKAAL